MLKIYQNEAVKSVLRALLACVVNLKMMLIFNIIHGQNNKNMPKISTMKLSLLELYYSLERKKKNNERDTWAISSGYECVFYPDGIFCNCFHVVQHNIFKLNIFKSSWKDS